MSHLLDAARCSCVPLQILMTRRGNTIATLSSESGSVALQHVEREDIIAGNYDDEEDGDDAIQYQL